MAFSLLLIVIIAYGAVLLSQARNNKERTRIHALSLTALRAALNTGPNPVDFFEAACNTLASTMFKGNAMLLCDPVADFPLPKLSTDPRVANYSGVISEDGVITCSEIKFTYTASQSGIGPSAPVAPPKFCLEMTCNDSALSFLNTTISALGAESCITGSNVVGYMAVDYSNSLHNIYQDWPASQSKPIPHVPPSFATLGNSEYFSPTNIPTGTKFYTDAPGSGPGCKECMGLGSDATAVMQQIIDLQPIGIREAIDPNTGKLLYPITPPFSTKEIDARKNNYSATELNIKPLVDNPDELDPLVLQSLPQIINLSAAGSGSDGQPDPIQYIAPEPLIPALDAVSRQWVAPTSVDFQSHSNLIDTEMRVRSHTRGGHITQNTLLNRCFGAFLQIYKQAAEQALYIMGNYGFRMGVMGFNNWIFGFLPLYPQSFFENSAYPAFYGQRVTDLPVGGPLLSQTPPNPSGGPNDYMLLQYGDPDASVLLTQSKAVSLVQGASLCASSLDHDVNPDPAITYKPYGALPNPYDPSMPIVPTASCPGTQAVFNNPLVFSRDGKCYRDVDIANYHLGCQPCDQACGFCCDAPPSGSGMTTFCSDPGLWISPVKTQCGTAGDVAFKSAGLDFVSSLIGPVPGSYLSSSTPTDISPGEVLFPYRWCVNNPPNVAVGIQSMPSGPYSKTGYDRNGTVALPTTGSALSDPEFPYHTHPLNTFTPGAMLIATRALKDPQLVTTKDKRVIVLVTDGVSNVSVWRTVHKGPGGTPGDGYMQNEWFPKDPDPVAELPEYPGVMGSTNEIASMHETLHLLHNFVNDTTYKESRVIMLLISSANLGQAKEVFLTGLKKPNAIPGQDPSAPNPNSYNFCKPDWLVADPTFGLNLPGEQVVTKQSCDPNSPGFGENDSKFRVIDLAKQQTETYDQFRTRVYQEIALRMQQEINSFSYSK